MAEIRHKIRIESPIEKVYAALTTTSGLAGWWTKWTTFAEGQGNVGSVIRFGFADDKMDTKFKIVSLDKNKRVEWDSLDEPGEWSYHGTKIIFELKEETVEWYGNKKMVAVTFTHSGLKEGEDFYPESNTRWGFFLLSLKDLLEKGKGSPVPDDIYM